jgi:sirohydrochlorin ferrochelatase
MIDGVSDARVRRYIDRRDEPSVPQVLGRFALSPGAADAVAELLGEPNNRARGRQTAPEAAGGSKASSGRSEGVEAENRTTEAGLPGLPGLPEENDTPSPEIGGGGGGSRACRP